MAAVTSTTPSTTMNTLFLLNPATSATYHFTTVSTIDTATFQDRTPMVVLPPDMLGLARVNPVTRASSPPILIGKLTLADVPMDNFIFPIGPDRVTPTGMNEYASEPDFFYPSRPPSATDLDWIDQLFNVSQKAEQEEEMSKNGIHVARNCCSGSPVCAEDTSTSCRSNSSDASSLTMGSSHLTSSFTSDLMANANISAVRGNVESDGDETDMDTSTSSESSPRSPQPASSYLPTSMATMTTSIKPEEDIPTDPMTTMLNHPTDRHKLRNILQDNFYENYSHEKIQISDEMMEKFHILRQRLFTMTEIPQITFEKVKLMLANVFPRGKFKESGLKDQVDEIKARVYCEATRRLMQLLSRSGNHVPLRLDNKSFALAHGDLIEEIHTLYNKKSTSANLNPITANAALVAVKEDIRSLLAFHRAIYIAHHYLGITPKMFRTHLLRIGTLLEDSGKYYATGGRPARATKSRLVLIDRVTNVMRKRRDLEVYRATNDTDAIGEDDNMSLEFPTSLLHIMENTSAQVNVQPLPSMLTSTFRESNAPSPVLQAPIVTTLTPLPTLSTVGPQFNTMLW